MQQGTIRTAGAQLYYEVRGKGTPILVIQGGLSEAGATEQLTEELAERYQVISYDRRGLSRSTVSPDAPVVSMSRHAEDAAAILAAVSAEPARVIGASIGALIGVHLAVQHPERVATLVAHEPPMSTVVADPHREVELDTVAELARDDVRAAIQHMASLTGSDATSRENGAHPAPPVGDLDTNLRRFFAYDFPAVRNSPVDAAQVAAIPKPTMIIPTGGVESNGQWEHRCAHRLAHELGRELIELPGGHNGLISHPWAIAAELKHLFMEESSDAACNQRLA